MVRGKQLNVDYSKNVWKEENRGLSLGLLHIKEKKIENCNSVGAGAQNIGKVIGFWPNFDLNFNDILRA